MWCFVRASRRAHDDQRDGQRFHAAALVSGPPGRLQGAARLSRFPFGRYAAAPPGGDGAHRQPQPSGRLHRLPGRMGRPRGGGDHRHRARAGRARSERARADRARPTWSSTTAPIPRRRCSASAAMATRPGSRASSSARRRAPGDWRCSTMIRRAPIPTRRDRARAAAEFGGAFAARDGQVVEFERIIASPRRAARRTGGGARALTSRQRLAGCPAVTASSRSRKAQAAASWTRWWASSPIGRRENWVSCARISASSAPGSRPPRCRANR